MQSSQVELLTVLEQGLWPGCLPELCCGWSYLVIGCSTWQDYIWKTTQGAVRVFYGRSKTQVLFGRTRVEWPVGTIIQSPASSHGFQSLYLYILVVVVQLLSCAQLFVTPWTAACQASLSLTISQSLLKLISLESVMPSNHLILCHLVLLLPSVFPSIRVFYIELALCIR